MVVSGCENNRDQLRVSEMMTRSKVESEDAKISSENDP